MQHRIVKEGRLLDECGILREPGWATAQLLEYHRKDVKANKLRLKEWDYYLITDGSFGLALTVADNGYMGLDSISLLRFDSADGPWEHTESKIRPLPMGRTKLPENSREGHILVNGKGYIILFENNGDHRRLTFHMDSFCDGKPIDGSVTLTDPPQDSMVIATPFPGAPKSFYYNQKINCLRASGDVEFDGQRHVFAPDTAFAVLDWGRGVWTYSNTWYWSSASGSVDGVPFGFNLGYGFGDTSAATENMLFYDGIAHKLEEVSFLIPGDGSREGPRFLEPWQFTSSDGRFEAVFRPVLDRASLTEAGPLCSDQHQVFGSFTGRAMLDDGRVIRLENFFGFAEKVRNKW